MHDLVEWDKLLRLEDELRKLPQLDCPVEHFFAPGVYVRQITMPAGLCCTGKIHKYEHVSIISKGDVSVLTAGVVTRIKAPYTFVAPAGTKRALYVHEETIWATVHPSQETDLVKLEAELIAPSREAFLEFKQQAIAFEESAK